MMITMPIASALFLVILGLGWGNVFLWDEWQQAKAATVACQAKSEAFASSVDALGKLHQENQNEITRRSNQARDNAARAHSAELAALRAAARRDGMLERAIAASGAGASQMRPDQPAAPGADAGAPGCEHLARAAREAEHIVRSYRATIALLLEDTLTLQRLQQFDRERATTP